ncbi:MAG: cation-transporting P-type ATPase [Pseudomonadales bacterium]
MERERTGAANRAAATVPPPHAADPETLLGALATSIDAGLDTADARRRRRRSGLNVLVTRPPRAWYRILLDQFASLMVGLLGVAALLALFLGQLLESASVVAVILLNAAIGYVTELRAVRSMEALRSLSVTRVNVRRHGRLTSIPARGLVPGDIVVLDAGDVVSADLRLLETSKLQINESVLTGESMPVNKQVDAVPASAALPERLSMAYSGTAVTRGSAVALVIATGMDTELGRIADLVSSAAPAATPLEARIDQLSRQFMWIALALAAAVGIAGAFAATDPYVMIEAAIALAVATVPEGLPMVATLALARGMWRMARRNALIERLSAVETLGSTTVILTDKTGTLTQNRMTVTDLVLATGTHMEAGSKGVHAADGSLPDQQDQRLLNEAALVAALCSNAELSGGDLVGEPMEVALLALALGISPDLEQRCLAYPELAEIAFDPERKMMATLHRAPEGDVWFAVKGAPGAVIRSCERLAGSSGLLDAAMSDSWLRRAEALAAQGLRVLALAAKRTPVQQDTPYSGLTLLALVGLSDPPRDDVADAIRACRQAGIRVVMVTGDHAGTAMHIAAATGLAEEQGAVVVEGDELGTATQLDAFLDAPVFARVTPAQKLALIEAFQRRGEVVAMLGDGVNDAPALRKADIGIAMGRRGSQVARQASDMVLSDDRFGSIVQAVFQGRVIFGNIRRFIIYLMSCNLSELLAVGLAALVGAPLPLLPLQILYLNLVTDVFPAFALGAGEGEPAIMRRPPRPPSEPLLARRHWLQIAAGALVIAAATLSAFALCLTVLRMPPAQAVTVSFLTLALAQVWHVFNVRARGSSLVSNEITRDPFVWGAVVLCGVLIALPVYTPVLGTILGLALPGPAGIGIALAFSFVPLLVGQIERSFAGPQRPGPQPGAAVASG